jgi:hypothetical protein
MRRYGRSPVRGRDQEVEGERALFGAGSGTRGRIRTKLPEDDDSDARSSTLRDDQILCKCGFGRGLAGYGFGSSTAHSGIEGGAGRVGDSSKIRGFRDDERIGQALCDQLVQHDFREVEIEVKEGGVSLKGVVQDRHAKSHIEKMARGISGVKNVHNHLKIRAGSLGRAHSNKRSQHSTVGGRDVGSGGSSGLNRANPRR